MPSMPVPSRPASTSSRSRARRRARLPRSANLQAVDPADVVIVGGGVIGLAAAYRLAEQGARVRLVDASGGRGASWVAAGMLAPVSEASFGEDELTRLNLAAVPAFQRFAAELAARTGQPVGLRTEG